MRTRSGPTWLLALALACFAVRPGAADEEQPNPPGEQPNPPEDAPPAGGDDAPPSDEADDKVPFVEEVNAALEQGTRWLLAKPKLVHLGKTRIAHWGLVKGEKLYGGGTGPQYRHPAGPTALALYTLLKCGVPPDHPTIVEGFAWLKTPHSITEEHDGNGALSGYTWSHSDKLVPGSYEASAMILALCAKYDHWKRGKATQAAARGGKLRMKDPADLEWLRSMVDGLVARRGMPAGKGAEKREARRGWRYNIPEVTLSRGRTNTKRTSNRPPHANQDLSSTQLATLALFSAHRFGVEAKPEVWFDIVDLTLASQEKEGPEHDRFDPLLRDERYASERKKDHARGFMYIPGSTDGSEGAATGSMTACGVANLLMAREVLTKESKAKADWEKGGYERKVETAIWDGIAWLDLNWSSFRNTNSHYGYHVYYLYALERAMDLLGKNLVGEHTWYLDGAREILSRKKPVKVKVRVEKGAEADGVYWETGDTHEPKDVLDTCFALLFLKRATKDMIPPPPTVTSPGD